MNASSFEERKRNLYRYFTNRDKWREIESGEIFYYKGKRNLKELQFILDLVFGDKYQAISTEYFYNNEKRIIGGSVICEMYVDADFNGWYQGTAGATVFTKFTLVETSYFVVQSSTLEGLNT